MTGVSLFVFQESIQPQSHDPNMVRSMTEARATMNTMPMAMLPTVMASPSVAYVQPTPIWSA